MRPENIEIERNESGIFAYITLSSPGKSSRTMIWSKVGLEAEEYGDKSDADIQKIVFDRWRLLENSRLRRKRNNNK